MNALRIVRKDPQSPPELGTIYCSKPPLTADHVLVQIKASVINASDVLNASGGFPHTTFPRIPGRDFSGIVVEGPSDLVGKEVFGTSGSNLGFSEDGVHAEYCLVPRKGLATKPHNLSWAQAASVGVPFTTAEIALERVRLEVGETLLILGASGGVGSAAVQLAKEKGCKVISATRHDDSDINIVKDSKLEKTLSLTAGKGPDVVFDTTGSFDLMKTALAVLAKRGRLVFISAPRTGTTELALDIKELYRKEHSLVGCNSLNYTIEEMAEAMESMSEKFQSGSLIAPKEESLTKIGINEAVEAYRSMKNHSSKKYVICFEGHSTPTI